MKEERQEWWEEKGGGRREVGGGRREEKGRERREEEGERGGESTSNTQPTERAEADAGTHGPVHGGVAPLRNAADVHVRTRHATRGASPCGQDPCVLTKAFKACKRRFQGAGIRDVCHQWGHHVLVGEY